MPASVGEQIVAAMAAALNAPSVKPAVTFRTHIDAIAEKSLPAMVLYCTEETAKLQGQSRMLRTRKVRLDCLIEGVPPVDTLADPLYVYAVQTLMADTTLPTLMRHLSEASVKWEAESGMKDIALAYIEFEVVFVTSAADPTNLIQGQ